MKRTIILLENFNNYFNRKIKLFTDIDDYLDYEYDSAKDLEFNPNNDVSTEIVFNYSQLTINPNYLLVCENDSDLAIVSRWFILESTRLRNGQYRLKLRRDVIADNFNALLTAPIFVQKGWLRDTDPFIFNSEGMSFNQVKIGERLLIDNTRTPWIVAYISRNTTDTINVQSQANPIDYITLPELASQSGISQDIISSMINTDGMTTNTKSVYQNEQYVYQVKDTLVGGHFDIYMQVGADFTPTNRTMQYRLDDTSYNVYRFSTNYSQIDALTLNVLNNFIGDIQDIKTETSTAVGDTIITLSQIDVLRKLTSNKVISYQGGYYNASIVPVGTLSNQQQTNFNWQTYTNIANAFTNAMQGITGVSTNNSGLVRFRYKTQQYAIVLTAVSGVQTSLTLSGSKNVLYEKGYDMICLPYYDLTISTGSDQKTYTHTFTQADFHHNDNMFNYYRWTITGVVGTQQEPVISAVATPDVYRIDLYPDDEEVEITIRRSRNSDPFTYAVSVVCNFGTTQIVSKGDICRRIATEMPAQLSSKLYDIQLLPYCPLDLQIQDGIVDVNGLTLGTDYDYIKNSSNNNVGICFYCKNDSFQVYINEQLVAEDSLKVDNECNAYRLVSPNYQGSFNFSLAKNGGYVASFTAFCTYKPYTPYIKVAPAFTNLYGAEYGDNRGLILGGDFSLTRMNDKWEDFQLNNKNYQNIFNRDIQNLDFNQSIEMRQQIVGASIGAIGDATKGAMAGGMINPASAVAGAVIGGVSSMVGGIIDTGILAQQQREARQYSIDKYNYQLGNIKALPYTLTKVSSWDINSKIYPFIEFYSCTDEEKEAFKEKLKYESMTVMRVGTIQDYITSEEHYFKGELIRVENVKGSTEIVQAIYEELLKGVYIYE